MNIFVTGIAGFLGSTAAKHFLRKGWNVIGLVRDINNKTQKDVLSHCSIVQGDILDKELIQRSLSRYEVDYVLHLASNPIVRVCDNDPYSAYMTNIVGTLNLVEGIRCLKKKPIKVIVLSSDKSYGPTKDLPYTEETPFTVGDTYGTSKSCQDMIARSFGNTYDLPIITCRCSNIYGPADFNYSRLIPRSILKLLKNESPILYSDVAEYIREFIYVDDVVSAFDTLFEKGQVNQAYNIGCNTPSKIRDVIEMIRDKINPKIDIGIVQKDFFEIPAQYIDANKLMSLGWAPKINLSEGLDLTIDWYSEQVC